MIKSRNKPDGLPFRVYERHGVRVYSIGYKMKSGRWAFRFECPVSDLRQIAVLRKKAIEESVRVTEQDMPIGSFAQLIDAWFEWQDALPLSDTRKRAASTIAENKREAANLKRAFGHLLPREITRSMGYQYLDACLTATGANGKPRPRPEKGNKEISLARLVLEWGIQRGVLEVNPFDGITKLKTDKVPRLVEPHELALAVEVGRAMGGSVHIVAMALKTAWLCLRRSVEVRALMEQQITEAGILWDDGKDAKKAKVLIEWSDDLRATIQEAQAIQRTKVAGTMYVFGNMRGQRYTKGGWKAVLDDLMRACVELAAQRGIPFRRFNLQDCRPMGVTTKLTLGHTDTQAATGHTTDAMIARVYDRRKLKTATPAG